jgi:chemotaxis protein MotB
MTGPDALNPGQVVLLGYGQYHPLVPNSSATAQAQNRRVNIVISPSSKFVP